MSSKSNAQRQHFKNRMEERFGLKINNETYRTFIKAIETNTRQTVTINGHSLNVVASYRAKQSHRVTIWALILGSIPEPIPVAFDTLRHELITAHPELLSSEKNLDNEMIPM